MAWRLQRSHAHSSTGSTWHADISRGVVCSLGGTAAHAVQLWPGDIAGVGGNRAGAYAAATHAPADPDHKDRTSEGLGERCYTGSRAGFACRRVRDQPRPSALAIRAAEWVAETNAPPTPDDR